jgi:hypothetical protein
MSHATAFADHIDYLDDLLTYIRAGKVIPIVGPELVTISHQGTVMPVDRYLTLRLAERFGIPLDELAADRQRVTHNGAQTEPTVSDVVAYHILRRRGKIGQVALRLQEILSEQPLPTPEPLLKLARIRSLRLFVSTTVDTLLAQAINEVRFDGASRVEQIAYTRKQFRDLEPGWEHGTLPTVFYLFGRVSESRDYVITEEDTLEWLHELQSESRRPEGMFDQLRDKHLLFIGCRFPDWLARFVIRIAKRRQLSVEREVMEVVADANMSRDQGLTLFLDHFSSNTKVFSGDAVEFVDMLVTRWHEKFPGDVMPAAPTAGNAFDTVEMRPGSVFISYASEDRAAAERLAEGLSDSVDVWLDRQQLKAGAEWDIRIRHNIRQCALFIPIISHHAAARDGYFRTEWTEARRRAESIDQTSRPFIVPLGVDDIPPGSPGIPDEFWARHVERSPGGQVTDELRQHIIALVRRSRRGG